MQHGNQCEQRSVYAKLCPCRELLDVLASRWGALAIGALENSPQRFGQLQEKLEGISPKVLSTTLKKLEDFELISREVFAEVPVRVEYSLTDRGRGAAQPLKQLRLWIEENA